MGEHRRLLGHPPGTDGARRGGRRTPDRHLRLARWRRSSRWAPYSAGLTMQGARPLGCRHTRSVFTGGTKLQWAARRRGSPSPRPVAGHEVPPAIHDQGGERLVAGEYPVEGVAHRSHLGGVQGRLAIDGHALPGGEERGVSFPKRHVESFGEMQDELPARPGLARLDEAQVPGRSRRLEGYVELAQPPSPTPVSENRAPRAGATLLMTTIVAPRSHYPLPYLTGNRARAAARSVSMPTPTSTAGGAE